ncbi:ACT domain-containing protein [Bacillaceae bacterium IKA-2]|nr:ACT domain-containing protein [Bacillaceae bacterium IKA-2]
MAIKSSDEFYLVRADILPDVMLRAVEAKILLNSGKCKTINEATQTVNISRSAFYKYKDSVLPFHTMVKEKIMTLSIHLEDRSGTLSNLLTVVAQAGSNVLTINQTIPLLGRATITLSIETASMTIGIDKLVKQMEQLDAVDKVELIGSGA